MSGLPDSMRPFGEFSSEEDLRAYLDAMRDRLMAAGRIVTGGDPPETLQSVRARAFARLLRKLPRRESEAVGALFPDGVEGEPTAEVSDVIARLRGAWIAKDSDGPRELRDRAWSCYIYGNHGHGKTAALCFIGRAVVTVGIPGGLDEDHPEIIAPTSFEFLGAGDVAAGGWDVHRAASCGVLLIDELHRVADAPKWKQGALFDVLRKRHAAGTPTIAAGRLAPAALADELGMEWVERLCTQGGRAISCGDVNYRHPEAARRIAAAQERARQRRMLHDE